MPTLRNKFLYPVLFIGTFLAYNTFAVEAVKDLDYKQYAGTWYEIARLPNKHERELVEVTSTFKKAGHGKYQVINQGFKGSRGGKKTTIKADVSIPDPEKAGDMKLKIWFFNIGYRVIDVDKKNYEYALVTSDSDKYLWIFCKSPVMDQATYDKLVSSARQKGFDTDKLEKVSQTANIAMVQRNSAKEQKGS